MEPQINEPQSAIASLKKVTPLSKYLAITLFIIMPFLGGYVGYVYAPEKVVEVEKEVIREVEVERTVEVPQVVPEATQTSGVLDGYSSENISWMIEGGDVVVYQGGRVVVAVANVTFGMADSDRIVVNVTDGVDVLDAVLSGLESEGRVADYVDRDRIEVEYVTDVYSGDDIIMLR